MPNTGETPEYRMFHALPLIGTQGQKYVEKRGIPIAIAHEAGVRFDPDWNGREAVIAPMIDLQGMFCSTHGRYLQIFGKQNKMLTIGKPNGIINVSGTTESNVIILVEGLFDALSLAVCGYGSFATVGRWASWLPEFCVDKTVLVAFDATHSGEADAAIYRQRLKGANVCRFLPPDRCKDWNTALLKRGQAIVTRRLHDALNSLATTNISKL